MSRKSYYTSSNLEASYKRVLRDGISNPINQDYTMEAVNNMLYSLLGTPGKSAGKAQEQLDNQIQSGVGSNGTNPSAYSSAQVQSTPAQTGSSSGGTDPLTAGISGGIGLIRDIIGMFYNRKTDSIAFNRQNKFYEDHLSMSAKAQEYADAGLNPMGLAGSGVGATSAPSVQGTGMEGGSALVDVLGQLLNYKTRMAEIGIEKERVGAYKDDTASKIEYRAEQRLYQQKVNEWFDTNQIVSIDRQIAETKLAMEQVNTQITEQQLNQAGVTKAEADAALSFQLGLQKQFENSPEYRNNTLRLQQAQANMYNADAAHLYEDIKNLASQRDEITSKIALNYANTDVGRQQLKNLGITEQQLQFAVDHQKGDLVFQRIGQVTSALKDVGVAAAGIASAATGTAGLVSSLTPAPKIGFR